MPTACSGLQPNRFGRAFRGTIAGFLARRLLFVKSCIHGVGGGEFPVSVWLDPCATCRTRHGQYLFRSEFFALHRDIMPRSWP